MEKCIYILPIANLVIESPIQIGNFILTPSINIIKNCNYDIDYSLLTNLNKNELHSILSLSKFQENSLILIKDDYFSGKSIDENFININKLSQKADRALDLIRITENNFGLPEQLPGIPGITQNGFQVIEQLHNNTLEKIQGKVIFMIREGIGLYPNNLNENLYQHILYNCLYVETNEVNFLIREAIHRVCESMYMNNLNTSFIYLFSTLEMLASTEYLSSQKVKAKILPFISSSKKQYFEKSEYFKYISKDLRTEIVHNGKNIFDLLNDSKEIFILLNEIKTMIIEFCISIIKKDIKSFKELEQQRDNNKKSLNI